MAMQNVYQKISIGKFSKNQNFKNFAPPLKSPNSRKSSTVGDMLDIFVSFDGIGVVKGVVNVM